MIIYLVNKHNLLVLGKWSEEEESVLYEAVHQVTNTKEGASVTAAIAWSDVAKKVKPTSHH